MTILSFSYALAIVIAVGFVKQLIEDGSKDRRPNLAKCRVRRSAGIHHIRERVEDCTSH